MRASTAYFAGAGTVIVAIAGGLGGGILFADMHGDAANPPVRSGLSRNFSICLPARLAGVRYI